ncbi:MULTISPECIES: hypothetical protein [Burkholderiaceae]|uniref:hypothetical protein n=1 Tax=Burkholderiaceae TaxID=119060 RepID=UPI0009694823|nr:MULTISPECIES: hypothetical protein [Burkholderiaceae]MCF2135237.1 hypothetical protein [Mycetohabitans sp. B3]MCG1038048.1 hypothetical protein [Mycetohabitans sp. B7]SIT75542.1 hypothetical protein SAMN04487769_2527 [Burkholderia sp. b14]
MTLQKAMHRILGARLEVKIADLKKRFGTGRKPSEGDYVLLFNVLEALCDALDMAQDLTKVVPGDGLRLEQDRLALNLEAKGGLKINALAPYLFADFDGSTCLAADENGIYVKCRPVLHDGKGPLSVQTGFGVRVETVDGAEKVVPQGVNQPVGGIRATDDGLRVAAAGSGLTIKEGLALTCGKGMSAEQGLQIVLAKDTALVLDADGLHVCTGKGNALQIDEKGQLTLNPKVSVSTFEKMSFAERQEIWKLLEATTHPPAIGKLRILSQSEDVHLSGILNDQEKIELARVYFVPAASEQPAQAVTGDLASVIVQLKEAFQTEKLPCPEHYVSWFNVLEALFDALGMTQDLTKVVPGDGLRLEQDRLALNLDKKSGLSVDQQSCLTVHLDDSTCLVADDKGIDVKCHPVLHDGQGCLAVQTGRGVMVEKVDGVKKVVPSNWQSNNQPVGGLQATAQGLKVAVASSGLTTREGLAVVCGGGVSVQDGLHVALAQDTALALDANGLRVHTVEGNALRLNGSGQLALDPSALVSVETFEKMPLAQRQEIWRILVKAGQEKEDELT